MSLPVSSTFKAARAGPLHKTIKLRQKSASSASTLDLKAELAAREARSRTAASSSSSSLPLPSGENYAAIEDAELKASSEEVGGKKSDSDSDSNSESESESDCENEEELLAELERIRKERAAKAEALSSPSASSSKGKKIKRRWDDDSVFKNQAKPERESKNKKTRFVNDTVRNDFHRDFLNKYIK